MIRQMRMSSPIVAVPAAAALLLACGQARAQLTAPSVPIALSGSANTGQYGPNGPSNVGTDFFTGFGSNPSVGRTGGLVILSADTNLITGSVNSFQSGVWIWNGSNTNVVKYTDNPALGGVGTYSTSGVASQLIMNGAGQFAFRDGSGATGVLYTNSGTPGRLLKALDAAPGTGTTPATFASPGNIMAINASGSVATFATLTTGSGVPAVVATAGPTANNTGYWGGTPGALNLLVRQSDQLNASGNVAIPNVLVGAIDTGAYSYNDSGKLLFTGAMQGTGVNTTGGTTSGTNQGLMSTRNGYAEVIARRNSVFPDASGNPATGASTDGVQYRSINTGAACDMNNAGRVVFSSSLNTSAGATPTTNGTSALFSDTVGGTLKTIARHTAALPAMSNLPAGLTWGSTFSASVINGAGTVAFTNGGMGGIDPATGITVTSAANSGLFKMDSTGAFTKVLRSGDSAPAWPAVSGNPALGQVIAGANPLFSGTPSSFIMNAAGQMAFVESLSGVGIVSGQVGNNSALFGVDTDGTIMLIAQKGMLFHVGPGDDRIVSGVSGGLGGPSGTSGNEDGRVSSLDDNGNLVFSLQFADPASGPGATSISSGVFYAHIPAPGATALLGMGGLLAARRRRR
jgi:hypothetical protein